MPKVFAHLFTLSALGLLLVSPTAQAGRSCVMLSFDCPSQGNFVGYAVANLPSDEDGVHWWPAGGPDPLLCREIDRHIEPVSCVDYVVDNCSCGEADLCGHHPFDFHKTFNDVCEFKNKVHWEAWDDGSYMAAWTLGSCEE
ncbi:MAG: hypothetical protein MUC50_17080 [Myxococcota bacterium]|nr:hypothetical protein [Myxococcota bacterium]